MTPAHLARLVALRHDLHRHPEISGEEAATARRVAAFLQSHAPDHLLTGIGGHGVAAIFDGGAPGPTVMVRAELDALPIPEETTLPHASTVPGKGHLCGHDGHMTMVAALAASLQRRPAKGRVVLLFQPAEETGQGARVMLDDPQWSRIAPDYAFSLHNTPGLPLGEVALNEGAANCASRGMRIVLTGKTTHAAAPQDGCSPMQALSGLMPALSALGSGGRRDQDFALVTVTHATLGAPTFGIAPGLAELWVTLRSTTDARMEALVHGAEALVQDAAGSSGLTAVITYHEIFDACTNHPRAVSILRNALIAEQIPWHMAEEPQSWSEDFGQFGRDAKAAMFWLGAGEGQPQLHNPDYDFPDALIPVGVGIYERVIRQLLD